MGTAGVGVWVKGLWIGSIIMSWTLSFFCPSHNTGSTRGPNRFPRFSYYILDNNSELRRRRLLQDVDSIGRGWYFGRGDIFEGNVTKNMLRSRGTAPAGLGLSNGLPSGLGPGEPGPRCKREADLKTQAGILFLISLALRGKPWKGSCTCTTRPKRRTALQKPPCRMLGQIGRGLHFGRLDSFGESATKTSCGAARPPPPP